MAIKCLLKESFTDVTEAQETIDHGVASEIITENLKLYGLQKENFKGQCMDNAANMADKYNGVRSKISEINELARIVPVCVHTLIIIGVHAGEV